MYAQGPNHDVRGRDIIPILKFEQKETSPSASFLQPPTSQVNNNSSQKLRWCHKAIWKHIAHLLRWTVKQCTVDSVKKQKKKKIFLSFSNDKAINFVVKPWHQTHDGGWWTKKKMPLINHNLCVWKSVCDLEATKMLTLWIWTKLSFACLTNDFEMKFNFSTDEWGWMMLHD